MAIARTVAERVRWAQRRLIVGVIVAALLWAVSVAALLFIANMPLAIVGALGAGIIVGWRNRRVWSINRVALWIEEIEARGAPLATLAYAVVTAMDGTMAPASDHPELHAIANRANIERIVRRAWWRMVGVPAILDTGLTAILIAVGPSHLLHLGRHSLTTPSPPAPMENRLAPLSATVVPPAYSRLPVTALREPANISALIGSQVILSGQGTAAGVTAHTDSLDLAAWDTAASGWAMRIPMPKTPLVLTLRDREYRRLLALEPISDSAPTVKLTLPARDTTYQTIPKGELAIAADMTDDIGLHFAYVEYLISKGAEETFETKQVDGPRVAYGNARVGQLRTAIDLDTMKLGPGSVLHIRVVAHDYNNVTGPGKGVSETRTLRVAEKIDSTSINAAPPLPIDSMWVSQRLLNMRTDTLVDKRRQLSHDTFVNTSAGYGNTQENIRQRALAVIALLEDNGVGGSFQTSASQILREAVDLMWTAREDLGIAHPDSAQPSMRTILKILDELRLAHRYYLRGLMPPVAVNVARVRLTGKDSAAASARLARSQLEDRKAALAARIDAVRSLARTNPQAAADSLVFIRVAALGIAPTVAATLPRVAVDSALAQAERALEPKPELTGGRLPWAH